MKNDKPVKVLLVTGSSRGIGAEICRQAAAEGWKVCINYASSEQEADRLVHDIRKDSGIAIALQADVSREDEVITMFERIDLELPFRDQGVQIGGTQHQARDEDHQQHGGPCHSAPRRDDPEVGTARRARKSGRAE